MYLFPTLSNNYIILFLIFFVHEENSTGTCYGIGIIPYNTVRRAKKPAKKKKKIVTGASWSCLCQESGNSWQVRPNTPKNLQKHMGYDICLWQATTCHEKVVETKWCLPAYVRKGLVGLMYLHINCNGQMDLTPSHNRLHDWKRAVTVSKMIWILIMKLDDISPFF